MAAESMSLRDMLFWFFITLFGTGTYVIYGTQGMWGAICGVSMMVVGFGGMIGCAWQYLRDPVTGKIHFTWHLLQQIAANTLYRKAAMRLILAYVVIGALVYVRTLRADLDTYVMPRVLTAKQFSTIHRVLSPNDPHIVVNVVANSADRESVEYAAQLTNAIVGGGWEAHLTPLNPWAPDPVTHPYGNAFHNIYLALDQGINLRVSKVGQDQNSDSKHPAPEDLLQMAFQRAGINCGTGSAPDGDRYALTVEVGSRPLRVETQPSLKLKIARWVEGWMQ